MLTYGAVRGFYVLSMVGFKGEVKREWERLTVDFSPITNMIYQFIFTYNKLFCMDHRCIKKNLPVV